MPLYFLPREVQQLFISVTLHFSSRDFALPGSYRTLVTKPADVTWWVVSYYVISCLVMWPNQQLPHGGLSQALLTWIQNLKFKTHTETQTVNTYSWSNTTFLCLQYILPIYLISNSKSNYQCWIVCNISLWTCRVANLLMGCGLSDICLWTCWGMYLLMGLVWHCQAGAGVPVVPLKALQTGHVELALTLALSRYNP